MLLQFKRQQEDDHTALCKTNDSPADARQRFLRDLGSQLDFVTATGGPVCSAIAKGRPICDENIDNTCATHTSCFVKIFPDRDNEGHFSSCFCPSTEDTTKSKCNIEKPDDSSPSQEHTSSASDSLSASATNAASPTPSTSTSENVGDVYTKAASDQSTGSPEGGTTTGSSSTPTSLDPVIPSQATASTTPPDVVDSPARVTSGATAHAGASNPQTPIGAIVGAIVGGLLFLLLLIGVFLYFRRRKRKLHVPPSAEFLERGYGTRTPQPALFDGQRDSAAELLPDYDRGAAVNPPFEKEPEVVVASPEGYGVGHGLNKRQ